MSLQNGLLLLYLGIETRSDIRNKEISVMLWIVISIVLSINCIWLAGLEYVLRGMIPGIMLMAVSKVTKEAIGYGDGMVLIICGIVLGFEQVSGLLILAFLLQVPISLWKVTVQKVRKKEEMAFLPYILCAYMIQILNGAV